MKRNLSLILVILFFITALAGCGGTQNKEPDEILIMPQEKIYTEHEGVYLALDTVSSESITVVWRNDTKEEAVYGEYYYVEKYDEASGEWKSALRQEFFVEAIGLILSANSDIEKTYSLSPFNVSEAGRYRLRCEFYPGDGKKCNTWVEFDVGTEHSGYETTVKFMQYTWDGWGVSTKTVSTCDIAYAIIDELEKMTETGEKIAKISNQVVEPGAAQLPVERGTMWLEVGSKIYRIDGDSKKICRVDTHLGRGYLLDAPDSFFTLVNNAWQYHPYDYYTGSYNNDTDEIVLNNVYSAESTVGVNIKKVEIVNEHHPTNKITLELQSTTDQTTHVDLRCQRSDDDLDAGDYKNITLKAGETETVELSFGGWKDSDFWIYIIVDNTKICLRIEP